LLLLSRSLLRLALLLRGALLGLALLGSTGGLLLRLALLLRGALLGLTLLGGTGGLLLRLPLLLRGALLGLALLLRGALLGLTLLGSTGGLLVRLALLLRGAAVLFVGLGGSAIFEDRTWLIIPTATAMRSVKPIGRQPEITSAQHCSMREKGPAIFRQAQQSQLRTTSSAWCWSCLGPCPSCRGSRCRSRARCCRPS
jgi:hypothetical protein